VSAPPGWEVVFRGPTFAADTIAAVLEAAGFEVQKLTDTGNLWPGDALVDSRVLVPAAEAEKARELVEKDVPPGA
jgi:hypothetical protein